MKVELKYLAPYLPYKLQVKSIDIFENDPVFEMTVKEVGRRSATIDWVLREGKNFKPILRPLSDLVNEITHNNKKLTPLACLLISKYPKWFVEHFDNQKYKHITIDFTGRYAEAFITYQATHSIQLDSTYILNESFSIIQKLLEWHFDIYGLIEKGLAININTLSK